MHHGIATMNPSKSEAPDVTVPITVDGVTHRALPGQSVAAALLVVGVRCLRDSPRAGTPRGAFCMMGICQECLVRVDGHLVQACMEPVVAGIAITLERSAS